MSILYVAELISSIPGYVTDTQIAVGAPTSMDYDNMRNAVEGLTMPHPKRGYWFVCHPQGSTINGRIFHTLNGAVEPLREWSATQSTRVVNWPPK